MHLFYAPIQENGCCVLSEEESLHCSKVLRLKQGDLALVCNGKGGLYRCRFLSVTTKCCIAEIEEVLQEPNQNEIQRQASLVHVIVAPTKQMERMEWFLEKATEVGLSEVSFVICAHSERTVVKTERIEKILISAMKQSQQAYLPFLHPQASLKEILARPLEDGVQKFIAYCGPEYERKDYISVVNPHKPVTILIGPEGDFTAEEVALCVEKGYTPVSLGATRLRTETAALYACWAVAILNDFVKP